MGIEASPENEANDEENGQKRSASLWRTPGYPSWFTSDTASAIGAAMQGFGVSLVSYKISGSLIAAGWVPTLTSIVRQLANVLGGTIVDRHDRKNLVIGNCIIGVLLWGTTGILLLAGSLTFPVFLAIMLTSSLFTGCLGGATDAMLRSIIDSREYPKARSVNEGRDATITMIGNPVGGMLYSFGAWVPFIVSAILYMIAGISASQIRISKKLTMKSAYSPEGKHTGKEAIASFCTDFVDGWRFVLTSKIMLIFIITTALINFGMNGAQYSIELSLVGKGIDPVLLGLVGPATCIGLLAGSLFSGHCGDRMPAGLCICATGIISAFAYIPLCFTDSYYAIIFCSIIIGLPFPLYNAMVMGFVFSKTPDELQGRVKAVMSVGVQLLSMFSSSAAGYAVTHLGFNSTIRLFVMILFVAAAILLASKRVRRIPVSSLWHKIDLHA